MRTIGVIVYFHIKFQKGSAKLAWKRFTSATQAPKQTLVQWARHINDLEKEVIRHGTFVPFDDYLDQWCSGTREGNFLKKNYVR